MNISQVINTKETAIPSKAVAKDPRTSGNVELTAVQDPNSGQWYMATVPAGYVAYDEFTDQHKVDARKTARLLKEHTFSNLIAGSLTRNMGETFGTFGSTPIEPLDVSKYEEKMIVVANNHDTPIAIRSAAFKDTSTFLTGSEKPMTYTLLGEGWVAIPAGQTKIFSKAEYPLLDLPLIGLTVSVVRSGATEPTTGDVNVQFYGR